METAANRDHDWLNVLTERASLLEEVLKRLAELKDLDCDARSAQTTNAPEPILQQIDDTLAAIAAEEAPIDAQRTAVLDLQARVAREVAQCGKVLAEIDRFQQQAVSGILVRDGRPIWSIELWGLRGGLLERIGKISTAYLADFVRYVRDPSGGMPLHLGLFSVFAGDILGGPTADRSIGGGGRAGGIVRHQTVRFSFRRGSAFHFNCSYKSRLARDTDSGKRIIPDSGMRSDDLADAAGSWRMGGARTLLAELPLCRRYRADRSCRGCSD